MTRGYATLAPRILRPERPALAAARDAVAGAVDAREAWELLAARGLIPADWVDARGRVFLHGASRRARGMYLGRPLADVPQTAAQCALFAADATGVATAEALARELRARLAPWGFAPPTRVAWRVERRYNSHRHRAARWRALEHAVHECDRPSLTDGTAGVPLRPRMAWSDADARAVRETFARSGAPTYVAPRTIWRAQHDVVLARLWEAATRGPWRVPRAVFGLPPDLYARRFGELPDPFPPLLDIWLLGYAVDALTDDATVLVAPDAQT